MVLAEVGDYIEYAFYPRNHSVVRADYDYPCVPYDLVRPSPGFSSGWMPVDTILDDPPKWTVQVNNTDPIFFYCSGIEACDEYGMVGVVNPNANTSLDTHRKKAEEMTYTLQPGDRWPTEGPDPADEGEDHEEGHEDENGEYGATSPTSTPTVTVTPTSAATTSAVSATGGHSGLAPGAIAGIAIGAAVILLVAGIALWICGRRSRGHRNAGNEDGSWSLGFLGGKKDPQSGAATPATMPPAYNPHGMPVMTEASKGYPGEGVNTSIVERYGSPTGSPPPQVSPYYMQQTFPPHLLDPAAFNHNPYAGTTGLAQHPPEQHYQFYRPELDSGTPAPRSPPLTSGMPTMTNTATGDRNSVSMSGVTHSRGGSPDIINEMNAINRSPGTINQGGGAVPNVQEPMPQRGGLGMDIKRIDLSG
ncbi:hypothetical protein LTR24_001609 [Lithohypha guttulata]|uniref:Uncharacterized protein n=1 Tax=Lithohypha guttulata TaxID=1690604 RepID=A0ABR0KK66_9EURO|nr:hypothetical protein LTR24_001609 [Lithohypha guttulata]